MNWRIDSRSAVPLFQQVARAVKIDVLAGRLSPGDSLPSIRDLARFLKINPNTVARAYSMLEEEGFVEGRVGSGSRIRPQAGGGDALRRSILDEELRAFLDKALSLGFSRQEIRTAIAEAIDHE